MSQEGKPSISFWIVGVLALLWNLGGVAAYFGQVMMSAEDFAKLDPVQQEMITSQPFWVTAAFAIAVFAGFAGCIMLLFRKKIAIRLFWLSLIAVIVQFTGFFMEGYWQGMSGADLIMPVAIPVIAIGLILYSRHCERTGLLS